MVHTLHLAEALYAAGYPVRVVTLDDPVTGFFRPRPGPGLPRLSGARVLPAPGAGPGIWPGHRTARHVADAELPSWYAAADVFAFPSTKEGWGMAVLEAMSAGLSVVASDLPVFREYLAPGLDALLVPVDSPAALAEALTSVLGDQELAERLRAAGRTVAAKFTWEATAARHKTIYTALGGPPRPG